MRLINLVIKIKLLFISKTKSFFGTIENLFYKFKLFFYEDIKKNGLSWYYFCFQYKMLNHKILRFLANIFNLIIVKPVSFLLLKLFKIEIGKYQFSKKLSSPLKAGLLFFASLLIFLEILNFTSLEIKRVIVIILFLIGSLSYFFIPLWYLLVQIYKIRLKKYRFNIVVFTISIIITILRVIFCNLRSIVLGIAFCLSSSIIAILTTEKAVELIKPLIGNIENINTLNDKEVFYTSIYLWFISVPQVYGFQGLLEKMDSRWDKLKLINYGIFMQMLFLVILITGWGFAISLEEYVIKSLKFIAILFVFVLYLSFIVTNSYKMYRLTKVGEAV